jgi:hypothetical protein
MQVALLWDYEYAVWPDEQLVCDQLNGHLCVMRKDFMEKRRYSPQVIDDDDATPISAGKML